MRAWVLKAGIYDNLALLFPFLPVSSGAVNTADLKHSTAYVSMPLLLASNCCS